MSQNTLQSAGLQYLFELKRTGAVDGKVIDAIIHEVETHPDACREADAKVFYKTPAEEKIDFVRVPVTEGLTGVLSHTAIALKDALLTHASQQNLISFDYEALMAYLRCSRHTLKRAAAELKKHHVIAVYRPAVRSRPPVYMLNPRFGGCFPEKHRRMLQEQYNKLDPAVDENISLLVLAKDLMWRRVVSTHLEDGRPIRIGSIEAVDIKKEPSAQPKADDSK